MYDNAWKYKRCALAHFEYKKNDIQKPLCCCGYLKSALCYYDIMSSSFLWNRKKCKFLHPFFRKLLIHILLDYTYSYPQYVTSKLLRCKCLKWLHLIMRKMKFAVRNSSRKRAHLLYFHLVIMYVI